jgi:hypothetical protein
VPWPTGGVADTIARVVAGNLSERLGQRLIVEYRPFLDLATSKSISVVPAFHPIDSR